jgi:hypothetical protein
MEIWRMRHEIYGRAALGWLEWTPRQAAGPWLGGDGRWALELPSSAEGRELVALALDIT